MKSIRRSTAPLDFRLAASAPRFAAAGLACTENAFRSEVVRRSDLTAGVPTLATAPSDWKAGVEALAKGARFSKKVLMLGAAGWRFSNTGVAWSAKPARCRLVDC